MTEWQPIKTAPRDGRPFLAYWKGPMGLDYYVVAKWFRGDLVVSWTHDGEIDPSHWMPIQSPAEASV